MVADVNGDGRADLVGFGRDGVFVAQGRADGTFATAYVALNTLGTAAGFTSNDRTPRYAADVTGDGRADLIALSEGGVLVAYARPDGTFAAPQLDRVTFGAGAIAGGWSSNDLYPRVFGDLNNDGNLDLIGFGDDGVFVTLASDKTWL